jgi:membrane protease YdiL (CAAX protease family)
MQKVITGDRVLKLNPEAKTQRRRLDLTLGLVGAIWTTGLAGHFTRLKEWPALYLYVLGTFGLTAYTSKKKVGDSALYITRENLKPALLWGGLIGAVLFGMDVSNTYAYYKRGGKPMTEMEDILVKQKFLYLFPVLIVAEEFLWRGLMLSALMEKGMSKHKAIALTTLCYTVNHYAVAPVGMKERSMMAGMAVPIGFANGYLTCKTKNLWSGVLLHLMTMLSMVTDIFIIPRLIRSAKSAKKEKSVR